jgi:hypothetical protein
MSAADRNGGNEAQLAMDKLFGVEEPRANIQRPAGYGDAQPGRNEIYSRALLEARERFPNDGIAAHRFAEAEASRVMRVRAAASVSLHHSEKILVDVAFLEVFGGAGASLVAAFTDHVLARGRDGKFYRIGYTAGISGVTFGDPQEVEESSS